MGREEQIINERLKKLEELRKLGIEPYAYCFDKQDSTKDLQEKHEKLEAGSKSKAKAVIAGRVMTIRDIGKLIFADLQDSSGRIQVQLQEGETSSKEIDFFKKFIDTGDFIGVEGTIARTKRGELSIIVKKLEILTKSILPLPEKWHGLQDKEERYRKRYLDLIMNPDVRKVFETRARIIDEIRAYLKESNFLEVETPTLQPLYGGADAKPFVTELNALKMKLYLSISPELYLKKLTVGGFERVFTICKNFRNEGIDKWHNPEFTMMEIYQAYADYNTMIELAETLLSRLAKKLHGKTKIEYQGQEIDFKPPFQKISMFEAIKKYVGINVEKASEKELKRKLEELNIPLVEGKANMINALFEEGVQSKLIQPTFIIDYPKEICPLTKEHRKNPGLVERFELFVNGVELANAYSELTDSVEQERRLKKQVEDRKNSKDFDANLEANKVDNDFLDAMKIGLPVLGGIGIGIDRLTMFLTNQPSIRDVILFPFMKPTEEK